MERQDHQSNPKAHKIIHKKRIGVSNNVLNSHFEGYHEEFKTKMLSLIAQLCNVAPNVCI